MTKITWFIILLFLVVAITFILFSSVANSAPPILVDQQTGKYLGNLSSNPYGQYGSKYSPDCINNSYGQYGSEYSNDSPNNP